MADEQNQPNDDVLMPEAGAGMGDATPSAGMDESGSAAPMRAARTSRPRKKTAPKAASASRKAKGGSRKAAKGGRKAARSGRKSSAARKSARGSRKSAGARKKSSKGGRKKR
jgi:hypothetical protein